MLNGRPIRMLLPLLAAIAAVVAYAAPPASAVSRVSVWLNEGSGVLSITGTEDHNDYAAISRKLSATTPGGYVLVINVKNWEAADFSANCAEGGGLSDWQIVCPALNAKRLTFDGKAEHDSFLNNTSVPSEAHGGPGIDVLTGGSAPDVLYGDGDNDMVDGRQARRGRARLRNGQAVLTEGPVTRVTHPGFR